jgi:tRNA nucleotidyltransferase (CCA-adding enzyme)
LIRKTGPKHIGSLLAFRKADLIAHGCKDQQLELLSELESRIKDLSQKPLVTKTGQLALSGREIMQILHLPPGPKVGKILNFLMEAVTDDPQLNTKQGLRKTILKMKD